MHVIAGKFKVKPESRDDMIALARSLFDASRAEPGNITYNFYEDRGNDDCFLFFEEWQSQEATDFHFQTVLQGVHGQVPDDDHRPAGDHDLPGRRFRRTLTA